MHMKMQTLEGSDRTCLPYGLSVMNTFTEMTTGSKQVAVIVKNLTATLISIAKCIKFAQVVAMYVAPHVEVAPGTLEKLDEIQGIQQNRISVEWRKEMLFQQLELSGLEGWSDKNQAAAQVLLALYHDIFSLEPGELGCSVLAKHEILVIDDEPFKERFQRIPPPMVDEVCAHMKEMMEMGAICPSQSLWCYAIVIVCKKDGGLWFCIDFHKLNVRTKKDFYPLPWIQEAIESLVGTGCFSCLDLKAHFWQISMDEALKQYTAFTMGNFLSANACCLGCLMPQPCSKEWCRTARANWTRHTAWFTWKT